MTPSPTPILDQQRAHYAGRDAKTSRAEQMLAAYNGGLSPLEIAHRMGVTQRCVYVRLNALGVEFEIGRPDDLWSLPEAERRIEITRRAARGAREALKQFQRLSPLSTEFTGGLPKALTDGRISMSGRFDMVIKEITSTQAGASHG